MDVFAATLRAFDLALFVFRKAQDNFERLLAIFAVKLIARHDDLRRTPDGMALNKHLRPGNGAVKACSIRARDGD